MINLIVVVVVVVVVVAVVVAVVVLKHYVIIAVYSVRKRMRVWPVFLRISIYTIVTAVSNSSCFPTRWLMIAHTSKLLYMHILLKV